MLALGLVALFSVRTAILVSVVPGILAALAIVYAIRKAARPTVRERVPIKLRIRPVLQGDLGRLLGAITAFEVGNVAATLLILRATQLLTPGHGTQAATSIALGLYVAYNVAATVASVPAGHTADLLGQRGPVLVMTAGVALFGVAYAALAFDTASVLVLALPFVAAGLAIGCVETAEHAAVAALARADIRGSVGRDCTVNWTHSLQPAKFARLGVEHLGVFADPDVGAPHGECSAGRYHDLCRAISLC